MDRLPTQGRKLLVTFVVALLGLSSLLVVGFTVSTTAHPPEPFLPPSEGPGLGGSAFPNVGGEGDEDGPADGGAGSATRVDVIVNGDFEKPFVAGDGVAPDWEGFGNGQAQISWYEELWPEAVRTGERAQLMEIFLTEPNVLDRVVAIFQTVNVAPNASYDLTINAIMRSQAPEADRNNNEFEMHWGVDFSGQGNIENVQEWNLMPLEEQFRLGSTGEFPEDVPLFYETITGTINTGESNRISLFIRGLKKFSTGTEVNFDVDDVSLVGPPPGPVVIITPELPADDSAGEEPAAPAAEDNNLPDTGVILPENVSEGSLILGGLVLVVLGAGAAAGLLKNR